MKAYLVDPEKQTIEEVNTAYPELKTLLKCEYITTFTIAGFGRETDTLYLDDESLLKNDPGAVWTLKDYDGHFCGNGLLVGINEAGEDMDQPHMTIDLFREHFVVFEPHMKFDKLETIPEHYEHHPALGQVFVTGNRSLFKHKDAE